MNLSFPQLLLPSSSADDSSAKTRNARLFGIFLYGSVCNLQPSAIKPGKFFLNQGRLPLVSSHGNMGPNSLLIVRFI